MTDLEVRILILRTKACFADLVYTATNFSSIGMVAKAECTFRKARLIERYIEALICSLIPETDFRYFSDDFDDNFN